MRGEQTHSNISGAEVVKRWCLAGGALVVAVLVLFNLMRSGQPVSSRLILFPVIFLMMLGYFQARRKHCVLIGAQGGKEARAHALHILLTALLWALILTGVVLMLSAKEIL